MTIISILDEIFKNNSIGTLKRIIDGNALFLKFWNINIENKVYKVIPLLGNKEGISGSSIGGACVGINNSISEDKKMEAAEVIKYMTSMEIQKELVMNQLITSAIPSVYQDEEVCRVVDCKLINNIQAISRPNSLLTDYDEYSNKFRKYISQYLYEDRDITDVLNDISNISEMHYISSKPSRSILGFIVYAIGVVLLFVLAYTSIFVYLHQNNSHFDYMNVMSWLCTILGFTFHVFLLLSKFGIVTVFKCHLQKIFLSFGFTLCFVPVLYYLILNFPDTFKFKAWLQKNKFIYYILFFGFDMLINGLTFITPYTVENKYLDGGKNYGTCVQEHTFGKIISIISLSEKVVIILTMAFLLFEEWNIKDTETDVRFITSTLTLDSILYFLYIIINSININELNAYFLINSMILIMFFITNFVIIYGVRIIMIFMRKDKSVFKNDNHVINSIISSTNIIDFYGEGDLDEEYANNILYRNRNNSEINFLKRWKLKIIYYHYCKRIPLTSSISQDYFTNQINPERNNNTFQSN
ncbi:hypothetical protein PIROE2DRAFT_16606 [Piromyces sp. E2]|nr:hypothetical protein PIROE2DRAFT_16606 [Piromyces sp. E2]|eukprot:OUM58197.1 hypothetical protein PIROE2DRAFT_16606 [Piromyces sp. E2]